MPILSCLLTVPYIKQMYLSCKLFRLNRICISFVIKTLWIEFIPEPNVVKPDLQEWVDVTRISQVNEACRNVERSMLWSHVRFELLIHFVVSGLFGLQPTMFTQSLNNSFELCFFIYLIFCYQVSNNPINRTNSFSFSLEQIFKHVLVFFGFLGRSKAKKQLKT